MLDVPNRFDPRLTPLRDHLTPRLWHRPWQDPPGFLLPNCPCCSSGTQMYTLGGADAALATFYATCDKTDMAAETTAAKTTGNLSQARGTNAGGIGNPSLAGYVLGGNTASTGYVATADKLSFSNDTTASVASASLSLAREEGAALSERSSKGYYAGGLNGSGKSKVTDKLTFSGDSTGAVTTANLSSARNGNAGMNGTSAKGYWAGGATGAVTSPVKTADIITFSSDTVAAQTTANLSAARAQPQAGSDGSTKGYWAGGQNGAAVTINDKLTFSTDTTAALTTAGMDEWTGASGSDGNKLCCLGGTASPGSTSAGGNKILFVSDTMSALGSSANLTQSRLLTTGFSQLAL